MWTGDTAGSHSPDQRHHPEPQLWHRYKIGRDTLGETYVATYLKRALSGSFAVSVPGTHLHTDSDEAYIVLSGTMVLEVAGERVVVATGEVCFIPSGVVDAVVRVETPVQVLVIRAPAAHAKVYRGAL